MSDQYPPPNENSGEVYGDAGSGRPEGWHIAPVPPAAEAGQGQGFAAVSAVATPVSANASYGPFAPNQPSPKLYAHKNEVLYAFGGVFFPGLVLLLMGGDKKTGIIMLCCLAASIVLSVFLIGIPLLLATYVWSVIACFREARRQNEAHGFES